ncbi:LAGLIDADG family homing endonuclease [Kribbella sp.]|uniref:LAGLIDADG family homing endonuclease n=1 Tax=Kribbella sp. TaxID=1871183 RepID=UPI002D580698|nr:LAGLIDADG family homing endonuclease [Kribbella sp.]HZX06823.1 LAGLIDADG family homing endonuclease [Kribbella sp.]
MFDDLGRPDVAYAIGLLQTDGTHSGSLDGKGRVSLELAVRDEGVLSKISALLPCYSSIGHRTRTTNFADQHETATLRFYDQATRRSAAAVGILVGRKADRIAPPVGALAVPDYLRGLLDGDGSVGFTRKGEPFVSIVTASPAIAGFVCDIIREVCGVARTARPNRRDGVYNILVLNLAAASLAAWAWYSSDVLGLERKKTAAQQVAQWQPAAEKAGRYQVMRKRWTAADDLIVLAHGQSEAARILGRSVSSVSVRRWRLRAAEQGLEP